MGFSDFSFSVQMRDTMERIAASAVERLRPQPRYGIVQAVDYLNARASVTLNGDPNPVQVNMADVYPTIGQRVRVEGTTGDRYITAVVGGGYSVSRLNVAQVAETDPITAYPKGVSVMSVGAGSGWSLNGGYGTIVTYNHEGARSYQTFTAHQTADTWKRVWYDPQGINWSPWIQDNVPILSPAKFTNGTAPTAYPLGDSILPLSGPDAVAGKWEFAGTGKWGVVRTFRATADPQAEISQEWRRHHANVTPPEMWIRGGNHSTGWSPWREVVIDNTPDRVLNAFTAMTNWQVTASYVKKVGPLVECGVAIRYTGTTAISVPADGNIGNQQCATLAAGYRPYDSASLTTTHTGPIATANIGSTGILSLTAVSAGTTITNGFNVGFHGVWMVP